MHQMLKDWSAKLGIATVISMSVPYKYDHLYENICCIEQ